ncbi:hypothetical protein ONZ43_g3369 [Nemania bipapillata]|uniref:Uncharacterized protein n=1 Tax=Nemania bipapillata TaxID=110536 RepID=A0ACC2IX79_9PEZI|nr:hypothetical protein ONZ43_g3369 [Nemania bipapillata]
MHSQVRQAHRRSRVPLSCDPCRSRKLKCNREKPCQNCAARGEHAACKFRGPVNNAAPAATMNGDATRQRLDHLEELVKKLIAERPQNLLPQSNYETGICTPDTSRTSQAGSSAALDDIGHDSPHDVTGKTVMDGVHSVYIDGDDWSVVLQEINELRRTWNQEQEQDELSDHNLRPTLSHTVDGSSLLFDQVKPLEKMEILSTIPPKHEVDGLISQFFDREAFPLAIPPILHEPTFMRLLFSILGITMLAYHQYGEPPKYKGLSESLFQLYRIRTAQCLLKGDIAKCLPYTVETLRFNATAELNRKDDNRRGLWIMTGVVVRAAINMGYHRDPAQSPGISVMQAEYRRRVWYSVVSMDDMASFLGGFPRTTSAIYADTLEPRNLHDWELSEDMTRLPLSRPLDAPTTVRYLILKARLFRELGRVADFNSSPSLGSYDTVMDIDRAVHDVYKSFPAHMKALATPDAKLQTKTPPVRKLADFSNISLVAMYHRGVCTLHRKFLAKSRHDGLFKPSQDRCVSSALSLLAFQEGLQPAFYRISQTRQMLMLGMMVLFLELTLRRKAPEEEAAGPNNAVLLAALEKSCAHLEEAMKGCDELRRAHHFLSGMLSTFRDGLEAPSAEIATWEAPKQLLGLDGSLPFDNFNANFAFDNYCLDTEIDWNTWDTFIEESSYEVGPIY